MFTMPVPLRMFLRTFEFIILFFGIPVLIYLDREFIHPSVLLLPVLVFVILILRYRTDFKLRELYTLSISRKIWMINLLVILFTAFLLLLGVLVFTPDNLFNLPRKNPWIFLAMCIFYPVFSAYPQEIIYRSFLFHRYGQIFKTRLLLILASSLSFSFMHIVYYSHVSLLLTFLLGLYASVIYAITRSVLFTAILHGILGIIVFAIGLGGYFWLDMPV